MKTFLLFCWFACAAAGCTGSHIGNPTARLSLALTGYDSADSGELTLSSGITVDEAWLVLDRVRLRTAEECGRRDDSTDVPAPIAAELVGDVMLPGRPVLEAQATDYCRVELRFDGLEPEALEGAPAELSGRSILVHGERADGVAFEVAGELVDSFRLDAQETPFALPEGDAGLVVGFAMDEWLDGTALDAADVGTRDGAPFIAIGAGDNEPLFRGFRDAIRESARLFRDDDRDGRLDASERTEVLGVGIPE
jgi:hypothetical protein